MKLPIIGILSGVALATLGISSAAQAAILLPSLTPVFDRFIRSFCLSWVAMLAFLCSSVEKMIDLHR